jgi:hypothetical protein
MVSVLALNVVDRGFKHLSDQTKDYKIGSCCLSANTAWVRARLCILQKGCTRLAAASDKVYQLLAHDRWFSPGTPASSTTKTGSHDIAELLLKVALNSKNQKINHYISNRV